MRLRLQKYPLKVTYKPGPQMFISDTPSQAALPIRHAKEDSPDYVIFQISQEEKLHHEVEETDQEEAVFIKDQRLEDVCQETGKNASLQTLMTLIMKGWPDNKHETPFVYVNTGPTGMN